MIGSLTNEGKQYYEGTYYKKKTDRQGSSFRYEWLINQKKSYGQAVNNLIATQGRYTIKTNWDMGFEVNGFIVDKNGKKYIISEIEKMEQSINPQVMFWFNSNIDTSFVLSLIEIENAEELK